MSEKYLLHDGSEPGDSGRCWPFQPAFTVECNTRSTYDTHPLPLASAYQLRICSLPLPTSYNPHYITLLPRPMSYLPTTTATRERYLPVYPSGIFMPPELA